MPTSLSFPHSGRVPVLTGRRRARTAPGTRAPAGRRRCGQSKEKRSTFNTRGHTAGAVRGKRGGRIRRTSITSGSSSALSPAAPALRGCGTTGARGAPWREQRGEGGCPGPAGCPSVRAAPPSWLPSAAPSALPHQRLPQRFPPPLRIPRPPPLRRRGAARALPALSASRAPAEGGAGREGRAGEMEGWAKCGVESAGTWGQSGCERKKNLRVEERLGLGKWLQSLEEK